MYASPGQGLQLPLVVTERTVERVEVVFVQPGILIVTCSASQPAKNGIGGLPMSPQRTGQHAIECDSPFGKILAQPDPLTLAQSRKPIIVSRPEGCLPVTDHKEFCQSPLLEMMAPE